MEGSAGREGGAYRKRRMQVAASVAAAGTRTAQRVPIKEALTRGGIANAPGRGSFTMSHSGWTSRTRRTKSTLSRERVQ